MNIQFRVVDSPRILNQLCDTPGRHPVVRIGGRKIDYLEFEMDQHLDGEIVITVTTDEYAKLDLPTECVSLRIEGIFDGDVSFIPLKDEDDSEPPP